MALACKPEKAILFSAFARMHTPVIAILNNLASQWHSNNNAILVDDCGLLRSTVISTSHVRTSVHVTVLT